MADKTDWTVWRALLAGETPSLHEGEVHAGYYRITSKTRPPAALAIWVDEADGDLIGAIHRSTADPELIRDHDRLYGLFSRGCRNPIPYETYEFFCENGAWPDIDKTAAAVATPGHNSGAIDDYERMVENLSELVDAAERYDKVVDETTLTKVAGLRTSIGKVRSELDKARKAEKEPHLRAGQAVDERYRLPLSMAEEADKRLKALADAYATMLLRKQREEEAAARRAAEEAARLAREAELTNRPAPEPVAAPVVETVVPQQVRTGLGRAASIRTKQVARIVDVDAVFRRYRMNAAVLDCLQRLVDADVSRGIMPDGIEVEEVADVRR